MAVDTFRRYIWLLETIDRLGYAEFETIQSEWSRSSLNPHGEDLPKRTFRNHITAIADCKLPLIRHILIQRNKRDFR